MTVLAIVILIALIATLAMWGVGAAARGSSAHDDAPDTTQRTDDQVHPPPRPDRPVPGSRTDRERKGEAREGPSRPISRRQG